MRRLVTESSLFVVAIVIAACSKAPPSSQPLFAAADSAQKVATPKASAASLTPLPQKTFGSAVTEKANTPLDSLVKDPSKHATKTVRTEGVVSAVCKSMGCWMEIGDVAGRAHVKMAGHSFFVPKNASGHHAVVQGKVLAPSQDECSEEAKRETGVVAKIEIEATGVEFLD